MAVLIFFCHLLAMSEIVSTFAPTFERKSVGSTPSETPSTRECNGKFRERAPESWGPFSFFLT